MSKDTEIDWADDLFDGDIEFNDDFDSPKAEKSFIAGVTSGFVSGIVDGTVGSSEAITKTMRAVLPSSYSTFFDKVEYFKEIKNDLIREFKEENYQNVKSLQNIAKKLGERIDNENNIVRKKLEEFSEEDFENWEKFTPSAGNELPTFEDDTHETFTEDVNRLIVAQQEAMANNTAGINEMNAQVGGTIVAAIKTGNRGLLGLESGMRDLLNYQRNVQYKMDKTMIELTAKNYVLDAKFYKFAEAANHKIIQELKKIAENSAKSDFQKTTLLEEARSQARKGVLGVVGKRVGGLAGFIRDKLSKENRLAGYGAASLGLEMVEGFLDSTSEGGGKGKGELAGNFLAAMVLRELPNIRNEGGAFRTLFDDIYSGLDKSTQDKIKSAYGKVKDFGNKASYFSNSAEGLINYYGRNWNNFTVDKYADYADYVSDAKKNGQPVMSERKFKILYNSVTNFGKRKLNEGISAGNTTSEGMKYTLSKRDASELTKVAQWKEINNITLVEVIPGWLSKIYESQERMRTGNDNFNAPAFDFTRGRFINKTTAREIIKRDIFDNSSFNNAANRAKEMVDAIDAEKILTNEQSAKLALAIAKNADRGDLFNPFEYLDGIEGFDPKTQKVITALFKKRFNITDAQIKAHANGEGFGPAGTLFSLMRGDVGDLLNKLSSANIELRDAVPNVAKALGANREIGYEDLMREEGIIKTDEKGLDYVDVQLIWDKLGEYLGNPNDDRLSAYIPSQLNDAGKTRFMGGRGRTKNNITNRVINNNNMGGELSKTIETLTDTIKEQIGKMDLSTVKFDLEGIPDKFDTLNATADEQRELLKKIAECTCRTANGWANKTATEKEKIDREEKEGKKSLLDRIKGFSPKGFFNKSIEALANNSPLVLTGLAAGLAGYAFKDPRTAAIIAGGAAVGYLYGRIRSMGEGSAPSDDENILNENGDVLLYASKLRNGDYWDQISKTVLKTWKDIKGAVYDAVSKTYVTLSQLTGKLFGPDNRRLFLAGLSKVRDFAKAVWNKIDIGGMFSKVTDMAKNAIFQQDVYVEGDAEPRLTRNGFKNKRYYCIDPDTKKPFVINGWNEIKGPVYELDSTNNLTQIITAGELAQGLMTSTGLKLDTVKKGLGWAIDAAGSGLKKFGLYAKEKAGIGIKKVNELVSADYSPINSRLDRIYYLLCDEFGRPVQPLPNDGIAPQGSGDNEAAEEPVTAGASGIFGNAFKARKATVKTPFENEAEYPHKVRLNSLEDQEIKEEEAKRDAFYDDVHSIKEQMEGGMGDSKDPKKKKGLWGMMTSILGAGFGFVKKLFTNPIGLLASGMGMLLKSILKSPLRLIKLGSLLFRGVFGLASPIFKLLRWGFGGIMGMLARGLGGLAGKLLPNWMGGGKKKSPKSGKKSKTKTSKKGGKKGGKGKWGFLGALGLGAGLSMLPSGAEASEGDYPDDFDYNEDGGDSYVDNNADAYSPYEDSDLYGDDDSDGVADSLMNTAWNTEAALGITGAGITKAGSLANRFAPAASEALMGGKLGGALGMLGKGAGVASKFAGAVLKPLAAIQAALAFSDTKEVSKIFDTNVVSGTQRASHAITDFLGGDLISGAIKGVAGAFGIDASGIDGMATRAINTVLDSKLAQKFIPGLSFLKNYKTDVSSTQRKIRMAMYGIADTASPLAMLLENVEREMLPFMKVDQGGHVQIDKRAPTVKIIKSLSETNLTEAAVWFSSRFLPIYEMWLSATHVLGYSDLDGFDSSKHPAVIKVANKVEGSIVQFDPYPYDISPSFSKKYPIMDRKTTEALLEQLNKTLAEEYKKEGVDAEGNIDTTTIIPTAKELREGKPDDGIFDKIGTWLNNAFTDISKMGFEEPKDIVDLDISDLHPDNGKMDELTMVRLGAYGNTESNSVRVDAVLKLERYCEQFFKVRGTNLLFEKETKDILDLFKNTFQLMPAWYEKWTKWFNDRFLPVLKAWVRSVYQVNGKMPKEGWQSLSASNRSDIGHALIDVKVEIKNDDATEIWNIQEGPFFNTESGTSSDVVRKYITSLDAKRADQNLKDPTAENAASNKKYKIVKMTEAQKYAMYHGGSTKGMSSSNSIGYGDDSAPHVDPGKNYNPSVSPGYESGAYDIVDARRSINGTSDSNYAPSSTSIGGSQFNIKPREAKKTIINEFMKAGYKDPLTLAFAIANAEVETSLNGKTEDLNYSAKKLLDFSNFRNAPELAQRYGKTDDHPANPRMIARIAYGRGKHAKDLGNRNEDDGERFIGRGFTQVTGRYNYDKVGKLVGEDFTSNPERVGADPVASVRSTIGYFRFAKVIDALKAGNPAEAARIINSGDVDNQKRKVNLTHKYIREFDSGELKTIVDELSAGGGDPNEKNDDKTPVSPTPADVASAPLNGLDGTNKVNVPTEDSTDTSAPPITTPSVNAADAQPAPADTMAPATDTAPAVGVTSPSNTAADVGNASRQAAATVTPPPVTQQPPKQKPAEPSVPQLTPVYDSAVVAAIDKLSQRLESAMTQAKRVTVGNRNPV